MGTAYLDSLRRFELLAPHAFTVKVPATIANLGPGFDALGVAVDIWNEIHVEPAEEFALEVEGEGEGELSVEAEGNLVSSTMVKSIRWAVEQIGMDYPQPDYVPPVKVRCVNRIPLARGLGSSSAAVVGGVVAGFVLCGLPLNPENVLQLAADLEGHPDNATPAVLGGFAVGMGAMMKAGTTRWYGQRVSVPRGLKCFIYVPNKQLNTKDSRGLLPDRFIRGDVIDNIARSCMLVASLVNGDYTCLRVAMDDKIHQPYRSLRISHLYPIVLAVISQFSKQPVGVCLCGAGPSVMAVVPTDCAIDESKLCSEMLHAAKNNDSEGCMIVTKMSESSYQYIRHDKESDIVRGD